MARAWGLAAGMAMAVAAGALGALWAGGPTALVADAPGRVAPYVLLQEPDDLASRIAFYKARVERDPSGFSNFNELAALYLARGRASGEPGWFLAADHAARQSLKNLPKPNASARLVLAQVALARHDFPGAEALARQAAHEAPGSADSVLLTIAVARGDVAAARPYAERLVARAPGMESYMLRGQVRLAAGETQAALADLRTAIAREQVGQAEASAQARVFLSRALLAAGQREDATDVAREALRIRPQAGPPRMLLAELARDAGDLTSAKAQYEAAYAERREPAAAIALAEVEAARGDQAAATALLAETEPRLRAELAAGGFGHRRDLARLLLDRGDAPARAEARQLLAAEAKLRRDPETRALLARAEDPSVRR